MRILMLISLVMVLVTIPSMAQTTTTGDGPVAIADNTGTAVACQSIAVAGGPGSISDVNVELTSAHSFVGDLTVELTPRSGRYSSNLNSDESSWEEWFRFRSWRQYGGCPFRCGIWMLQR